LDTLRQGSLCQHDCAQHYSMWVLSLGVRV
jgi:hypothetical protein